MQIAPMRVSDETMSKYMEMALDALSVANKHFLAKDFSLPRHGLKFAETGYEEFLL